MAAYVDSTGVTNLTADIKSLADATYPANATIAAPYDTTASYEVGNYCLKNGLFYKCNTPISSGGEAWTPGHWTLTKVSDEFGSISPFFGTCDTGSTTANKVVTCADFNGATNGTIIYVYFSHYNDVTAPYLMINNGTPYPIYSPDGYQIKNLNRNYSSAWSDGQIVGFVYYNSKWYMLDAPYHLSPTNTTYGITNVDANDKYRWNSYGTTLNYVIKNVIQVTLPSVSDSNRSFSVSSITSNHVLIQNGYAYLSNPAAAGSDLTLTTGNATITVSGTLIGTTDIIATMGVIGAFSTGTAVT